MQPGSSPRPRHITAATQVLATRLTHNTALRVTFGNTPLHVLHLCDAQYLAPRFATCTSVTALTVHLKYVASSSALEALLSAAAMAPSLREVTLMGGVSAMEAAAMAAGLATFVWPEEEAGGRQRSALKPPAAPLNVEEQRVGQTPASGRLRLHQPDTGRASGSNGASRRRCVPLSARSSAAEQAHGTSTPAARSCRTSTPFADYHRSSATPLSPTPPELPLRAPQWRLRAGGVMWPLHNSEFAPRLSAAHRCPSPAYSSPPARCLAHTRGAVTLTLELHRLEEATAGVLLGGLRRASRVFAADVRLCVSNAEARRAGVRLAQEAKRLVAHHRQRCAVCLPPSPRTPAGAPLGGLGHPRRRGGNGVPSPCVTPLPRSNAPHAHRTPTPITRAPHARAVAPASRCGAPTAAPLDGRGGSSNTHRGPAHGRHKLTPLASPPAPPPHGRVPGTSRLPPPYTPPTPDAAAGPRPRARQPRAPDAVLSTRGVPDDFRCRGRHPSSPSSPTARGPPPPPEWRSARGGRLYSPPRWNANRVWMGEEVPSRDEVTSGGRAAAVAAGERQARRRPVSSGGPSSTSSRPAVCASVLSSSTWSSRSSSPLPRRPPSPPLRHADRVFADLVVQARAAAAATDEASASGSRGTRRRSPRTPPSDTGRQLLGQRGLCRLREASPVRSPTASPLSALAAAAPGFFCSPQYCLRRGSDGLRVRAVVSERVFPPEPASPSRCSCFVCRSHLSSRPPAASPAARASRPRPPPPSPCTPPSVPPSLAASPASARDARSPLARAVVAHVPRPLTQSGACGTPRGHSAAASLNGITPPRRHRARDSSGGRGDGRTASSSSAPSCHRVSSSTSRSSHSTHHACSQCVPDRSITDVPRRASHGAHLCVSRTQLPSPSAPRCGDGGDDDAGFVVYPSSVAFLRARVREINRHVVWHQVQSAKAAEDHARRLAALEVTFSDRVTEELTDIMMVLTDMEHGSRVGERP